MLFLPIPAAHTELKYALTHYFTIFPIIFLIIFSVEVSTKRLKKLIRKLPSSLTCKAQEAYGQNYFRGHVYLIQCFPNLGKLPKIG
jgi:hypothetical protein